MFDQLFTRPRAVARHCAGPLLEERIRYLAYLAELGMRRIDLQIRAHYVLVIAELLRLADRSGEAISVDEIGQKALVWAQQSEPRKIPGSRRSRILFIRFAIAWLRFLGRLQPESDTPVRFAEEIAAFAEYLRSERGLSSTTIEGRCLTLRKFLSILNPANGSLQEITAAQIDDALSAQITSGGYCRVTVHGCAGFLRSFFLYAERRGWCRAGLPAAINGPRVYGQETIPTGPAWEGGLREVGSRSRGAVKQQNPIVDCAIRVATRRSEGQIVQLQRRQILAIAKYEVVEINKGVAGFGLRVSRLGGVQLGTQGSADGLGFRHEFSIHE